MTEMRAEERCLMPSESYSLEKLHPVSNTFKYYFMIQCVVHWSYELYSRDRCYREGHARDACMTAAVSRDRNES